MNEQATDLQKLLETWEAAKPLERRSNNIRPLAHRDFPQEFFYRVAKSLEERVNRYRRNIMLLNRAIVGLANDNETLTPQGMFLGRVGGAELTSSGGADDQQQPVSNNLARGPARPAAAAHECAPDRVYTRLP